MKADLRLALRIVRTAILVYLVLCLLGLVGYLVLAAFGQAS